MKWLLGPVVTSAILAYLAANTFEYVKGGMAESVAKVVRPSIFVSVGTAAITSAGNRGFTKWVRNLRKLVRR